MFKSSKKKVLLQLASGSPLHPLSAMNKSKFMLKTNIRLSKRSLSILPIERVRGDIIFKG